MNGLFTNPFLEGAILVVLGIGCYVLADLLKDPNFQTLGATIFGIGLGYVGKSGVEAAKAP